MAFYIRKAFKTGPVRLNLSKGGLGLSAGITGARVGINTKGTYVHGGRHGLYYRKYLNRGKKSTHSSVSGTAQNRGSTKSGQVDLFRDTGVTFTSQRSISKGSEGKDLASPNPKILTSASILGFGVLSILFFLSLIEGLTLLLVLSLLLTIVLVVWVGYHLYWRTKVKKGLILLLEQTEEKGEYPGLDPFFDSNIPDRWKEWLYFEVHQTISELALKNSEMDAVKTIQKVQREIPLEKDKIDRILSAYIIEIIDQLLQDHMISESEEKAVFNLIAELNIPESFLESEIQRLREVSKVRNEMENPLKEINPGIPLLRGEMAYEKFEDARLLNERVLDRYQRDLVQYRVLGYEIDIEGQLILTDRRMLFVGRGSKEYRMNQILDITADPEAGIVELTVSNRKSPLIVTVKEPLLLAARVELILQEIMNT